MTTLYILPKTLALSRFCHHISSVVPVVPCVCCDVRVDVNLFSPYYIYV